MVGCISPLSVWLVFVIVCIYGAVLLFRDALFFFSLFLLSPTSPKAAACSDGTNWSNSGTAPCSECTVCTDVGLHEVGACTASSDVVCVAAATITLDTAKASIHQVVEYTVSVPIPRDGGVGTSVALAIELPALPSGGPAYSFGTGGGWADTVAATASGSKVTGTGTVTFVSLVDALLTISLGTGYQSTETGGQPHTNAEDLTVRLQFFVVDDNTLTANLNLEQASVATVYNGGSTTVNGGSAAAAVKIVLPLLSWTVVVPPPSSGIEAGDEITVVAKVEHKGIEGDGEFYMLFPLFLSFPFSCFFPPPPAPPLVSSASRVKMTSWKRFGVSISLLFFLLFLILSFSFLLLPLTLSLFKTNQQKRHRWNCV